MSGNVVPVLYFFRERILSLTVSPSPVASCEQMEVLSTEHIPTTRPDSTAGTPGDTALRFWTSAVVGICTWVY